MPSYSAKKVPAKLNPQWIKQTRDYFLRFLKVTKFPHPVRDGTRGSEFDYPEWLIMCIAIIAVKCKLKTYLGIHRMAVEYWRDMREGYEAEVKSTLYDCSKHTDNQSKTESRYRRYDYER